MIDSITIRNFKSLKDVTLDLEQINLLIGPNNSGKTNFLKALEFLRDFLEEKIDGSKVQEFFYKRKPAVLHGSESLPIRISLSTEYKGELYFYALELWGYDAKFVYTQIFGRIIHVEVLPKDVDLYDINDLGKFFTEYQIVYNGTEGLLKNNFLKNALPEDLIPQEERINSVGYIEGKLQKQVFKGSRNSFLSQNTVSPKHGRYILDIIQSFKIYDPKPASLHEVFPLSVDKTVNQNANNLVSFLDNMRDSNPEIIRVITKDLKNFLENFHDIRFEKVPLSDNPNVLSKKLGLLDSQNQVYWTEELSEGTLYFLMLLAIIHQPNPPKLLLLEEPEKGIHPRRITEVIDLIFKLAQEKDIQVILTTHSPIVVDCFDDIPESVFIFEMEDGQTNVKNLERDVIIPSNEATEKEGLPKIPYTSSLGEHWSLGFLGGVPK